jgi:hypothetical protein
MRNLFFVLALLFALPSYAQAPCTPDLYGVVIDPSNPAGNPSTVELHAAGAKWVRLVFKVEGNDLDAAFALYDPIIESYVSSDIWSLVVLNYETLPGKPGAFASSEEWADYTERFQERAGLIAAHYGFWIPAFEIWNEQDEPNPREDYDPSVPAPEFGVLLMRSYQAIRAAGSFAQIISGGADSGNVDYLIEAASFTGGLWADGVGLHPYGQRAPDEYPSSDWGFGNYTDIVSAYYNATGLPVWVTEIGTEDSPFEADYLFQIYATTRAYFSSDVVPHVFWFAWSDGMVAPFGLIDAEGNPKEAYENYVNETSWGNAGCAFLVPGEGTSVGSEGGFVGGCSVSITSSSSSFFGGLFSLMFLFLRRRKHL